MLNLLKLKRNTYTNRQKSLSDSLTIIKPRSGWQIIDFKELKDYRDLFFFLVWRDIKVLYAQTILGFSWAILQPLIQILILSSIPPMVGRLIQHCIIPEPISTIPLFHHSNRTTLRLSTGCERNELIGDLNC